MTNNRVNVWADMRRVAAMGEGRTPCVATRIEEHEVEGQE